MLFLRFSYQQTAKDSIMNVNEKDMDDTISTDAIH